MYNKTKTPKEYKQQINSLIKLTSKKYPEILKWKIDIDKYCIDCKYRRKIKYRLLNVEKGREQTRKWTENNLERHRATSREWIRRNPERHKQHKQRYIEAHRDLIRQRARASFDKRIINNPKKAMLCAAAGKMTNAVISRLGIRPTVCPHCGKASPHIDFHHHNHLFWRIGTFCCKSCHYYFNRDREVPSDKIINLKKLLGENNSH